MQSPPPGGGQGRLQARAAVETSADERTPARTCAPLLVAVPAGGVMSVTSEHLLLGVLWLAVALFVIAAILGWIG